MEVDDPDIMMAVVTVNTQQGCPRTSYLGSIEGCGMAPNAMVGEAPEDMWYVMGSRGMKTYKELINKCSRPRRWTLLGIPPIAPSHEKACKY